MKSRVVGSIAVLGGAAVLVAQMNAAAVPQQNRRRGGLVAFDSAGREALNGVPVIGPDVIVGDLPNPVGSYGSVGAISAYAIATTSCNIGDDVLLWQNNNNNHPVIAQNLYRYKDGRFEQIGLSWVKHGFAAINNGICGECDGNLGQVLGVLCSDPYSAGLNGDQDGFSGCGSTCGGLGPRFEVNATTGVFASPYFANGQSGDAIYKRLQVKIADLDPGQNAGAKYFGEGHYVTKDDATWGNQHNNASYREVVVGSALTGGAWPLSFTGQTAREDPAIQAWQDEDPTVELITFFDSDDGKFILGAKVTGLPSGDWQYEYALYNMNSHRSARSFAVPVPSGISVFNTGFRDVDHHSGDGEGGVTYDDTDWPVTVGSADVSWATDTFAVNPNANALRWGTLYNFRFEADAAPGDGDVTVGLYRLGTPDSLTVSGVPVPTAPSCPWDCDGAGDGIVNAVDLLALLGQFDPGSPDNCTGGACDFNGDGCVDTADLLKLLAHFDPQGAGCPQ